MLSKSVSTSTKLAEVSNFAKLLFTWIIPHCDDFGHIDAKPKIVKGIVVPLCDETIDQVAGALTELESNGLIETYESDGRKYLEIIKWEEHQTFKNDRPRKAIYPSRKPMDSKRKPEDSIVQPSEVKLSEVNLSEGNQNGAKAPTPKEIAINFFYEVERLKAGDTNSAKNLTDQINALMEKHDAPYEPLWREIVKFTSYWTEKNKSGTKQRWETEKTFEIARRLTTWFGNVRGFNQGKGRPLIT